MDSNIKNALERKRKERNKGGRERERERERERYLFVHILDLGKNISVLLMFLPKN